MTKICSGPKGTDPLTNTNARLWALKQFIGEWQSPTIGWNDKCVQWTKSGTTLLWCRGDGEIGVQSASLQKCQNGWTMRKLRVECGATKSEHMEPMAYQSLADRKLCAFGLGRDWWFKRLYRTPGHVMALFLAITTICLCISCISRSLLLFIRYSNSCSTYWTFPFISMADRDRTSSTHLIFVYLSWSFVPCVTFRWTQ